jgi:hypothetical protein
MFFFEIIEEGKQSSAIKVDELKLNASFLNSKKTQDNQEQESADAGETFFIVLNLREKVVNLQLHCIF